MKKILLLIIVLVVGVYYYNNSKTDNTLLGKLDLSKITTSKVVIVTGVVIKNFKILNKSFFELSIPSTNKTIMIVSKNQLPKVGSQISIKLKKIDVMTLNDRTFSLYKEIE